eukprot:4320297-Alexandrium_andersonii.AAC.1
MSLPSEVRRQARVGTLFAAAVGTVGLGCCRLAFPPPVALSASASLLPQTDLPVGVGRGTALQGRRRPC